MVAPKETTNMGEPLLQVVSGNMSLFRPILYNGRKRMFKGHKWERTLAAREKQKKILIRDMPARLERFKQVR
jgi:hypothetical protein